MSPISLIKFPSQGKKPEEGQHTNPLFNRSTPARPPTAPAPTPAPPANHGRTMVEILGQGASNTAPAPRPTPAPVPGPQLSDVGECQQVSASSAGDSAPDVSCSLSREVQVALSYGLGCIPNDDRQREYAEWLSAQYPDIAEGISAVVDCYHDSPRTDVGSDITECMSHIVSPSGARVVYAPPDEWRVDCLSLQVDSDGEVEISPFQLSRGGEAYAILQRNYIARQWLFHHEYRGFFELVRFFYNRVSPSWPEYVQESIRQAEHFSSRVRLYEERDVAATPLNPPACPNQEDWERQDISIEGISYLIPIFSPRRSGIPSWIYAEQIQAGFEILKAFLTPTDLEGVLRRTSAIVTQDMAIYIGEGTDSIYMNAQDVFHGCNIATGSDRGAEYDAMHNHIAFNSNSLRPLNGGLILVANSPTISRLPMARLISFHALYSALFHEIAHAINRNLLNPRTRQQIGELYNISRSERSDRRYVPRYYILDSATFSVNGRNVRGRDYAMTNSSEFFAEWFTEYITSVVLGHVPEDGPMRARYQIMSEFLAPDGINPQAFSLDNMAEAFRAAGEDTTAGLLEEESREANSAVWAAFHIGAQSYGTQARSDEYGLMMGIQLGYLYRHMPRGFIGGVGALFDLTSDFGSARFDVGIRSRLGINTGPVDLFVGPEIGVGFIPENDATIFWFGSQVGLSFLNGGITAFVQLRFQTVENVLSVGAGLAFDIPAIVRGSRR